MAGETVITVVGNLTADPEIRTIGSGAAVASFTIASTPRTWNRNSNQFEDGQALFLRCSAWRDMAEHCAQSLSKGMRVIAQGRPSAAAFLPGAGRFPANRHRDAGRRNRPVPALRDRPGDPSKLVRQRRLQRQSRRLQQRQQQRRFRRQQRRISGRLQLCWRRRISGGASAPVNAAPAQSAPASDPWSSSDNSGSSFGSFGASQSFGGSSEFGGDSDEPEF